ncbi:trichohyalin-like [Ischnura elegans]|uniref:trichohyalin-like n=1 Tax=Ischnura elegans TaxID=197161 RepID=UPI001ED889A5|nr:trichohyalin-like [Ischnura elegans]
MAERSQREERFMLNRNIGDLTGLAIIEEVERDAESPVGQTESTIESIYQTPIALNPVRELLEEMRREREKEKEEMRERELLRDKEKQERRKEKERERELLREKEKEESRREKEQEKEELREERQSLQSEFFKMMGAVNNRISQQESTLVEVKEVTINLGERMNRIEGEVEVTTEQIKESTKKNFELLKGRLERLEQQGPTSVVGGITWAKDAIVMPTFRGCTYENPITFVKEAERYFTAVSCGENQKSIIFVNMLREKASLWVKALESIRVWESSLEESQEGFLPTPCLRNSWEENSVQRK